MIGKKCTLCGGRLDSRGICTECGLNSKMSEREYKVTQSDCDNGPLTHVHTEPTMERQDEMPKQESWQESRREPEQEPRQESRQEPRWNPGPIPEIPPVAAPGPMSGRGNTGGAGRGKSGRIIALIFTVIVILSVGVSAVRSLISNISFPEEFFPGEDMETSEYVYDPYEYVESELPEEGESVEYVLEPGNYIAGFHIAAGNYVASTENELDAVNIDDWENGIFLYEYSEKEDNYLNDLRIYEGAMVTIQGEDPVTLTSDNAQTGSMKEGMANPVTETVEIKNTLLVAGEDFEPGIYDLSTSDDYATISIVIYENGEELYRDSFYLSEDGLDGNHFRYVAIPEGAEVACDTGSITLTPSETIENTDYMHYYTYY